MEVLPIGYPVFKVWPYRHSSYTCCHWHCACQPEVAARCFIKGPSCEDPMTLKGTNDILTLPLASQNSTSSETHCFLCHYPGGAPARAASAGGQGPESRVPERVAARSPVPPRPVRWHRRPWGRLLQRRALSTAAGHAAGQRRLHRLGGFAICTSAEVTKRRSPPQQPWRLINTVVLVILKLAPFCLSLYRAR